MTNMEIILGECALRNIKEEVDTYAGWNRRGYSVKRGEHAAFSTKIWKPKSKVRKDEETEEETESSYMILVNAHFFKKSQVEVDNGKEA